MYSHAGNELPEKRVFTDYYSDLVTALSSADLSEHFVSSSVITIADHHTICSHNDPHDKAVTLLKFIAAAVNTGYSPSFYKMLKIMKTHGNEVMRTLADKISQSDELKGSKQGTYIPTINSYAKLLAVKLNSNHAAAQFI